MAHKNRLMEPSDQHRAARNMPDDPIQIKQVLRTLGRNVDLRTIGRTFRIYSRLQARISLKDVSVLRDAAYGEHPRHRLDVYLPQSACRRTPFPVVVFIHGGGFVQGDKSREANIGYFFAANGCMTIVANYRLAPAFQWPSGAQDLSAVLEWIAANGRELGADTRSVFLMGHSAGAAHVATYLFFDRFRSAPRDRVIGAVLLSGPTYDTHRLNPQKDLVYYGKDISRHTAMSVIENLGQCSLPIFIGYAELDPISVEYQSVILYKTLRQRNSAPTFLVRVGEHNHISEIMQIGTANDTLGPDIVKFIHHTVSDNSPHDLPLDIDPCPNRDSYEPREANHD